jgi:DNA-binding CsgD family transcriptional regulator
VLADCLIANAEATQAYPLVLTMVDRARELGLRSREFELLHVQAHLELFSRGEVKESNELCRRLLREPAVLGARLIRTQGYLADGLAYLGFDREASEVLDIAGASTATADDRGVVFYFRSVVDWLAGRFPAAIVAAERCRRQISAMDWSAAVIGGWAALELGTDQPRLGAQTPHASVAGSVQEVRALSCLAAGEFEEAEKLFEEAAQSWEDNYAHAALRCRWGAGLAALQAGASDRARERLLQAERHAQQGGLKPFVARIQRSLRQAGVRRTIARQPSTELLTAKEQEVLELVGAGLKTREIAVRLGVAPSTVDSQVKSAMRKLDSPTRTQAALAAANGQR